MNEKTPLVVAATAVPVTAVPVANAVVASPLEQLLGATDMVQIKQKVYRSHHIHPLLRAQHPWRRGVDGQAPPRD
eukprot:SAG11_NODE_834_length_6941_cov_19.514762_2_plen_75_part_00